MANGVAQLSPFWTAGSFFRRFIFRVQTVVAGVAVLVGGTSLASVTVSPSIGTSLEMQGDYVLTGVSNNGTLGVGASTSPGLVFDPDGTSNFGSQPDYLTPGMPAEGFSLSYAGSGGTLINNNAGQTSNIGSTATPTNVSGTSGFDNAVQWTGTISGVLTVDHVYAFDDGQKNIGITTTISALTDLTELQFARWIDPDCGGTSSINNRGNATVGLDSEDWVNSVSETNGATLGLYSESSVTHNTGFTFPWSQDPAKYITGGLNADGTATQHTGDDMIGVGFDIGTLNIGQSIILEYAYVVAADEDELDVGIGKWIGDVDNNWNNSANWDPERAPSNDENVIIESSGNSTLNHNVTGNTYGDWTFNGSCAQVTIQENDITIGAGKSLRNLSSHLQTFNVNVVTAGNLTIEGGTNGLSFQGLQVAGGSTLTFDTGSSNNIVNGVISGDASALTVSGTGTLQLSGANTYSGGTTVSAGTLAGDTTSLQGNIVNNGALEFSQATDGTYAGDLSGSGSLTKSGAGKLTFSGTNTYGGGTTVSAGTLAGNTSNLQGDIVNNGAVEFNQATDGTYDGTMGGNGSLTKSGAGTLTLSGNHTYTGATTVNAGRLIFNGTSVSNFAVNSGTRFGGNATVANLNNSGTVAPGNSIGTTTVMGDYVHAPSATYEVEINDSGQSDLLDITGAATINGGTVNVQPEPGTYTPGTRYTILEADGGVTGMFDALTGSVTGTRLHLFYNANDIELFLAPLYLATARTPNQKAVAAVLEQMSLSPTGDVGVVLNQLDSVIDTPGGEAYFDQLGGELFGTTASLGIANASLFHETISRRLRIMGGFEAAQEHEPASTFASHTFDGLDGPLVRGQSPSGCAQTSPYWRPWVQGDGVSGNAQGDGNASGFSYGIGGTTVAIDRALDDCTRFGLVGGYSNSQIHLDSPAQRATVNSGQFAAYLQRRCGCRYLTGIFSYGHNSYDTSRQMAFGNLARTASADYDGNELSFYLEGGRMFRWGSLQFQPYGALQYIDLYQSAFFETGAGAMNLDVNGMQTDSFRGQLGSRLVWYNRSVSGRVLAPELRALWRHEFLNEGRLVDASYIGSPGSSFTVAGADLGRDAAVLGGGCTVYFRNWLSLSANYDLLVNNTEVAHAGTGGLQFLW